MKSLNTSSIRAKQLFLSFGLALGLVLVAAGASAEMGSQLRFIIVGTAEYGGIYYPLGNGICRSVNTDRRLHKVHCSVESTSGTVANIQSLGQGLIDFGIVQSDVIEAAEPNDTKHLRTLFSLYEESFIVITKRDSSIHTFNDLQGMTVNVGEVGSGHRFTMDAIMKIKGWKSSNFEVQVEAPQSQNADLLCNDMIDAFVYAGGSPSAYLMQVTNRCDVRLVGVSDAQIDRLIEREAGYKKTVFKSSLYKGSEADISTIGVQAFLVSNTQTENWWLIKWLIVL